MLFQAQDEEDNCTRPGILLYCKKMPACLLTNQCTPLGMINSARAIVYRVLPHPNNKWILFKIVRATLGNYI